MMTWITIYYFLAGPHPPWHGRRLHALLCVMLAIVGSSGVASWQTSVAPTAAITTPIVRILSPVEDAIVSGPTWLRAAVEPPILASSAVFFVDGRQVCTAARPPFECAWDAGATIVQHQVRLVVNLVAGGRVVRTARTKGVGFAEKVDVDVVQLTVTVTDERGHPVKGLPRSAFHVSEDGLPQALSHFYSEKVPLELIVAVDISGSMGPSLPTLKTAVARFLGAVPPRDRVTLLGFNEDVFTLTRKTTDPVERVRAVNGLVSWGTTVLYDVILAGAEMLQPLSGRKALVVFTDGEDQGSHTTFDEVERRLQASDLAVYMIGQGQGVTSERLKSVMERLARPTGGRALFAGHIDKLEQAFSELLDELSNHYVLGYQPINSVRDDTWREITVNVDGQTRVRARQGYRATRE